MATKRAAARRSHRPAAPDKVLVTNRSALTRKYGKKLAAVDAAVDSLIAADRARGLTTVLVAVDDDDAMKRLHGHPVTDPKDAAQNKAAVDAVFHALTPDYLVLLGSVDVIGHQPLRNPVHDGVNDVDVLVPGDLAYACNAPFSDDPTDFIGPDRVVGRIPDGHGARDPKVLLAVLGHAATWTARPRKDFEDHLGITAKEWERSTVLSLRKLFGAAELHTSPHAGPAWSGPMLERRVHFINCHGAEGDPQFYGQLESAYPVSVRARAIAGHVTAGTIVAAECCYGGQLWAATATAGHEPVPIAYLRSGAAGFVGSSTIAYGPPDGNSDADLLCQYFLDAVLGGASLGRAMLEARQRFVRGVTVLSPVNTKTLAQFSLLGDPAASPVLAAARPKARTAAKAARTERRERLLEHAIANLRDTSVTRPAPTRSATTSAPCWPRECGRSPMRACSGSPWHRRPWPPSSRRRRIPRSTPRPTSRSCSAVPGRPGGRRESTSWRSRREEGGQIVTRRVLCRGERHERHPRHGGRGRRRGHGGAP